MPDWGTKIVDAGGNFHDITKFAFDALRGSGSKAIDVSDTLLRQDFGSTFNKLKSKVLQNLEIEDDQELSLENLSGLIMQKVGPALLQMVGESSITGAVEAVSAVEGPLGILFGEVLSMAINAFQSKTGKQNYKAGQWVLINNGETYRGINQNTGVIELKRDTDFFGDTWYEIPDEAEFAKPNHSIGFVLGSENGDYLWSVFNYKTGKEETIHEDNLRPADERISQMMDDNPELSMIREIRFLKDHDPTLRSYLPTDPGAPVMYKGDEYTIVKCRGKEYIIQDPAGKLVAVNASELVAGITLTSSSWNNEEIGFGSFTSLAPDALFTGEWVFFEPDSTFMSMLGKLTGKRRLQETEQKVLGMIQSVEGDEVRVVRAWDGKVVVLSHEEVTAGKNEVQQQLNNDIAAKLFKSEILNGHDPTLLPLGDLRPNLALGDGFDQTPENMEPFMKAPFKAHDRQGATATELGASAAGLNQAEVELNKQKRDEQLYDATQDLPFTKKVVGVKTGNDSGGGGINMGLILIGCALAWVAFAS